MPQCVQTAVMVRCVWLKTKHLMKTYTKEELKQIIENLLEHPDQVIDYMTNDNSEWDIESLLELVIE